jgi:hypothetical protein
LAVDLRGRAAGHRGAGQRDCSDDTKARLIREIIEYEGSHGRCTQTFIKKVRKQVRPKQG